MTPGYTYRFERFLQGSSSGVEYFDDCMESLTMLVFSTTTG